MSTRKEPPHDDGDALTDFRLLASTYDGILDDARERKFYQDLVQSWFDQNAPEALTLVKSEKISHNILGHVRSLGSFLFFSDVLLQCIEEKYGPLEHVEEESTSSMSPPALARPLELKKLVREIEVMLAERGELSDADRLLLDLVVRAAASFAEISLLLRVGKNVVGRVSQLVALDGKKSRVKDDQREELKLLNRSLLERFPVKTVRYQEIANLCNLSLDQVRYRIDGARRRKT